MNKEAFSHWLAEKMERRGIKPSQLAAVLEVNHVSVANWLKGKNIPESHNVIKMAEYFKVDPDYVLQLAGHRPAREAGELEMLNPELTLVMRKLARLSKESQELVLNIVTPILEREEREEKERRKRQKQQGGQSEE